MNVRLALAGLPVSAFAIAVWWWFVRCEAVCAQADRDVEDLFGRGNWQSALDMIDGVDARCHCSRFTSGDAPPQYAIAEATLRGLVAKGRREEAERALARARGPILRAFRSERGWSNE